MVNKSSLWHPCRLRPAVRQHHASLYLHSNADIVAMGDKAGAVASWQRALEAGGDADALNTKIQAYQ